VTPELVPGDTLREARVAPSEVTDADLDGWIAGELAGAAQRWLGVAYLEVIRVHHQHQTVKRGTDVDLTVRVAEVHPEADGSRAVRCDLAIGTPEETWATGEVRARWQPQHVTSLPLDRLKDAVRLGEVAGTFRYRVDTGDAERLNEALGRPPGHPVPTIAFGALDPVERRDLDLDGFLLELPLTRTGGGNAFNEVTYERPLRAGEELTVTTRYTEVYERPGSRGTLLFRVRENEMHDEADRLVATSRCGHVLGFRLPDQEEAP